MDLIDTHCHIDLDAFADDRAEVLARARRGGVGTLLVPAIERSGWPRLLDICREHDGLLPALGLHPVFQARHGADDVAALARQVAAAPPAAIGEIGLDFFIPGHDAAAQERLLEEQLLIAREAGLPVVLHVRKAHDRVLRLLRRLRFLHGGIAHAFNGSQQQAEQFIDLGFKLGFGGVITYERARKLRRLAQVLPLSALVLETDAPDLSPAGHRDERNSPEYLPLVLQQLAQLRDEAPAHVARVTTENARSVLLRGGPPSATGGWS